MKKQINITLIALFTILTCEYGATFGMDSNRKPSSFDAPQQNSRINTSISEPFKTPGSTVGHKRKTASQLTGAPDKRIALDEEKTEQPIPLQNNFDYENSDTEDSDSSQTAIEIPSPIITPTIITTTTTRGIPEPTDTPQTPATIQAAEELIELAHDTTGQSTSFQGCLYTCALCKAVVNGYKNFLTHKRTHKRPLPFKCTYQGCDFATAQKSDLTRHMRIHTGEKPYKCTYQGCDYTATQQSNLTRHIQCKHNPQEQGYSTNIEIETPSPEIATTTEQAMPIVVVPPQPIITYAPGEQTSQENLLKCSYCDYTTHDFMEIYKHREQHWPKHTN